MIASLQSHRPFYCRDFTSLPHAHLASVSVRACLILRVCNIDNDGNDDNNIGDDNGDDDSNDVEDKGDNDDLDGDNGKAMMTITTEVATSMTTTTMTTAMMTTITTILTLRRELVLIEHLMGEI